MIGVASVGPLIVVHVKGGPIGCGVCWAKHGVVGNINKNIV